LLGPPRFGELAALVALLVAVAGCGGGDGGPVREVELRGFPGPDGARAARVERVTDGDTIRLVGIGRVRLIGVDTPEVFGGVECYGREASAFAKRLLPPGARVRYRLGIEPRDRYGRALAYVWLDDGRLLNGLLVELGYAQPLTIPPNVDYAERFVAAARRARRAGRGLWGRTGCAG
jgi:micrococcal nuclease